MPGDRTVQQIRQARSELRSLNRDLDRFTDRAREAGDKGGQSFGKKFKAAAVAGVREMAKGAASQLGASLVQKFFERGESGGRGFGRGFKRAAKRELDTAAAEIAPSVGGGGMSAGIWKGVAIGAAVVGIAAGKTLIASIKEAMGQESLTLSLNALQPGRGGDLFNAFRADALRTGMDIEDMAGNVRKFLALGFDEKGAMKLNRAILDVAGGMGLTQEDAKGLGMALAQISAKGTAAMEELRGQIAERGIPIFELLATKLGVGQAELMKMIAAGKVSADTVIDAFSNMEGPLAKFSGGADRLGQSGAGMVARIKQQLIDLLRVGGESILPELKPALEDAIGLIERMKEGAAQFGQKIAEGIGYVRATLQELSMGEIFQLAGLALKNAFLEALDVLARGTSAIFASLQREDFTTSLEQRLRDAASVFKIEMLGAVEAVLRALSDDSPMGDRFAIGASAVAQARMRAMFDQEDEQARRGAITADPLAILKQEFGKAKSIFGLSAEDQGAMDDLLARIQDRRDTNVAAQSTGAAPAVPVAGPVAATPKAAAPDPRALLGGGIANALSLLGGGGSTVILQKQVDLATQTNRKIDETNRRLDEIAKNTKPQPQRGPISMRPTFS